MTGSVCTLLNIEKRTLTMRIWCLGLIGRQAALRTHSLNNALPVDGSLKPSKAINNQNLQGVTDEFERTFYHYNPLTVFHQANELRGLQRVGRGRRQQIASHFSVTTDPHGYCHTQPFTSLPSAGKCYRKVITATTGTVSSSQIACNFSFNAPLTSQGSLTSI